MNEYCAISNVENFTVSKERTSANIMTLYRRFLISRLCSPWQQLQVRKRISQ